MSLKLLRKGLMVRANDHAQEAYRGWHAAMSLLREDYDRQFDAAFRGQVKAAWNERCTRMVQSITDFVRIACAPGQ